MSGGAFLSGLAGGYARGHDIKRDKRRDAARDAPPESRRTHGPDGTFGDVYADRNAAMEATGGPTKAAAGDPDLGARIAETAEALGMDPVDLGTIISYETAGTFDPTKRGPTTQWGQHRGFIQFGEPQAKQYGVDWDNPVDSQLGPDGAVVRYFRENGWKPGMGMLDAYSIVNAGAPGLHNRSDANNGGAAGTVADKVNEQMAAHRAKAAGLLGARGQPAAQPSRAPLAEATAQAPSAASFAPLAPPEANDPILKYTLDKVRRV